MNSSSVRRIAAVLSCLFAGAVLSAQTAQAPNPSQLKSTAISPAIQANFGHLPLSFEQNLGQTSSKVQWLARGPESTLYLSGDDATVQINRQEKVKTHSIQQTISHTTSLRMSLLNAHPATSSAGEGLQLGKANYFTGRDSSRWQRNLPLYSQVRLSDVYRGVSLLYHGERGKLEYDFVVAPNANAAQISLGFTGAKPSLASNGDLVLPIGGDTKGGSTMRFDKPVAYQTINGVRTSVDSSYQIAANGHVNFHIGAYDHSRELVIDPTLVYTGTATTGSENDTPYGMAVDPSGELIIVGTTFDLNFPATSGAYQTSCGPVSTIATQNGIIRCAVGDEGSLSSAYIMKLSADGTQLIYATYLHGFTGGEEGSLVQSDASGNAVVVGQTSSNDFPLVNAPNIPQMNECQPYYKPYTGTPGASESICDGNNAGGGTEFTVGGPSGFVSKLSADGSTLLYSAFLGYTGATYPEALALDSAGNMYIANNLVLADKQNTSPGEQEIFYYTTPNALQAYGVGDQEIGFTVLSADGQTVKYSTVFGETEPTFQGCGSCLGGTVASGIAIAPNGQVYLAGETDSTMLPGTAGTVQPNCIVNTSVNPSQYPGTQPQCLSDAGFVAAFDLSKSNPFLWTTYITSGTNTNSAVTTNLAAVATDASSNPYVTGYTKDALYPTSKGTYATTCAADTRSGANFCDNTIFITKLNSTGTAYGWSTFLNPTQSAASSADANGIGLDAKGNVYIYGDSGTGTIPAVNPITQYPNFWYQPYAFVSVLDPTGSSVLFSSQIAPSGNQVTAPASMHNGLALDSAGNIYMVGLTSAGRNYSIGSAALTNWPTTTGTYTTAYTGTGPIPFFVKVSAILPLPTNSLSISPTTTTTGQSVTFTIEVTGPSGSPIPTGSVNLNYTTSTNSTPTLLKNVALSGTGKDTYSTTSLVAGTYTFTATYSGDSNYDTSTSGTATVTISAPATATLSLSTSASPVATGASVTFTAKATGGGATPSGTVTFLNGTTTLGTATLNSSGVATYATSFAKAGSYSISASYGGDSTYGTAVSSTVTEVVTAATATLSLSTSASPVATGASVTFTAKATGGGATPSGTVTFLNGTAALGTATLNSSGVATYATSFAKAGSYSISASYGGDSTYGTTTSSTVTEVVTADTATVTLASSAAKAAPGYSVTFTATLTGTGSTAPTGTVTFLDGTTTLGTGTISKGTAAYSTSALSVGTHSITASYGGDGNYSAVVSSALTETIANVSFTVSYNPSSITIKRGSSGTTTMTVTPSVAYSGTVTFACNGASIFVTCAFNPTSINWTSSNSTSAQTAVITIQTTAPHSAVTKAAGLGAGTWLGSLCASFLLLLMSCNRKLSKIRERLSLLLFLVVCTGALIGLSGCGGSNLTGGTPTGTQSLSVTFNGSDNGTPLSITVQ
ncbi:MAG: Ig-like domain-containing protein [Acidobacteriaceae bacterium]